MRTVTLGLIWLAISFSASAQQTYFISGTVTDEKGEALPGATIFLTNTQKATSTNSSGKFMLEVAPGPYELNIKMLGFNADIRAIRITNKPIDVAVKLQENSILLNAITIKAAPDKKQTQYLKVFIRNFIGESVNAGLCKILNPDVLRFSYDKKKNILSVSTDDLLVIENTALGYRLKYLLKEFKYYDNYNVCYFTGNPFFEELKGTPAQQKRWGNNRRTAYLGSSRHFFRSVINNTAEASGFAIYEYKYNPYLIAKAPLRYKSFDSLFVTVNNSKVLISKPVHHVLLNPMDSIKSDTSKAELYIVYKLARQPMLFYKRGFPIPLPLKSSEQYQVSRIRTFADTIIIDKELLMNPVKDLSFSGYWAWQRIAEFLPLDYASEPEKIVPVPVAPVIKDTVLRNTMAAIDSLHKRQKTEKLYLHLDKSYYAVGDTMRFKAYLLDEALTGSSHSGLFYVELINDSSRVVKRQTIMLRDGTAWGDIVLKKSFYAGNYTLRAYTNWMRNYGEEHFFTRQVGIVPAANPYWLVNYRTAFDKDKNVTLALQFSNLAHRNIGFRDMQISILQGTTMLLKYKSRTGPQGDLNIKFALPQKPTDEPLSILAEDISKDGGGRKITIPVRLNRPENIDLQFMPEGGQLIAGIPAHVGFKAIGEDGLGINVNGRVYNSQHQEAALFKSTHKGMGMFELTPQPGESYTAKIVLADGTKSYLLPAVSLSGIALSIHTKGKDSLDVELRASPGLLKASAVYYLIGQAREKTLYGAKIIFTDKIIHKVISKSIFPTGIAEFVLLDAVNVPITQRMVFVDHEDLLNIKLVINKESYLLRDSIGIQTYITDTVGDPVQGSFSLAVTDDSQVKPFDNDAENIASYMLLNPNLKGTMEEPGYYFDKNHPDREAALDNLLLTQGWVSYDWKQAFEKSEKLEYDIETEFRVKGRASNVLGLAINNTEIGLLSTRPILSLVTQTGKGGRFTFSGFPRLDTIAFHIQAKREFNVGLKIDEFYPPEFTPIKNPALPWYINSDSTVVSLVNKKQIEKDETFNPGKSKLLKEVIINAKKIEPMPPLILKMDEEAVRVERTGRKAISLYDLLYYHYHIKSPAFGLLVDGKPQHEGILNNYWLQQTNTEDIKELSVRGSRANYIVYVTTNSGRNEVISGTKGYAYRPMPISWPHRFYSPRYSVKTPTSVKDRRTTIYWEPNIITDASGKVEESFFSADQPGTYTVIIEGTDLNGNLGYSRQKIKVDKKSN